MSGNGSTSCAVCHTLPGAHQCLQCNERNMAVNLSPETQPTFWVTSHSRINTFLFASPAYSITYTVKTEIDHESGSQELFVNSQVYDGIYSADTTDELSEESTIDNTESHYNPSKNSTVCDVLFRQEEGGADKP